MIDNFYCEYLDQQVFHVTSVNNYERIRMHGALLPNSGERDFTFPKSKISYAKKNGFISLFDFYTCPDEKIEVMKHIWMRIVAKHRPTIAIIFNIDDLKNRIILNSVLGDGFMDYTFMQENYYIPRVEAWYPGPIGVDRFKRVLIIDWEQRKVTRYLQN